MVGLDERIETPRGGIFAVTTNVENNNINNAINNYNPEMFFYAKLLSEKKKSSTENSPQIFSSIDENDDILKQNKAEVFNFSLTIILIIIRITNMF